MLFYPKGEGGSLSAEDAIWADSLTKTYRSGGTTVTVFKSLSIRVPKGERVAIMGESGAGKSTLLHLLGGLERPDEGRIYHEGRDITKLGERELSEFRNSHVGFVWQNPSLLPEFTALENVSMPLLIRGVAKETAKDAARTLPAGSRPGVSRGAPGRRAFGRRATAYRPGQGIGRVA